MSQVTKIVLKVIDERLKSKLAEYADEEQYGFRMMDLEREKERGMQFLWLE